MIPYFTCVTNSFTIADSIMISDIVVQSSRLIHRGSVTNLHPGNIMLQTYTNTMYGKLYFYCLVTVQCHWIFDKPIDVTSSQL